MSKMSIDLAKTPLGRLPLIRQTLSGATMGTRYSAVFYMPFGTNVAALNAAVFAAVDRVDRQMSSWKAEFGPQSVECSRRKACGSTFRVS